MFMLKHKILRVLCVCVFFLLFYAPKRKKERWKKKIVRSKSFEKSYQKMSQDISEGSSEHGYLESFQAF